MTFLDGNTYEKLFSEHYASLCRYANAMLKDMDQSEDIVQQAFIKLWNKREQMDLSRSVKSYLYTSVRNLSINYIRDQKKFQSSVLDVEIYQSGQAMSLGLDPGNLMADELAEKIERALAGLPEKSLEVFKLSRFENLRYREIAEKLGVTVKTVEAHMSKALKLLREELKDYLLLFIFCFVLVRILLLIL